MIKRHNGLETRFEMCPTPACRPDEYGCRTGQKVETQMQNSYPTAVTGFANIKHTNPVCCTCIPAQITPDSESKAWLQSGLPKTDKNHAAHATLVEAPGITDSAKHMEGKPTHLMPLSFGSWQWGVLGESNGRTAQPLGRGKETQ